MPLSACVKSFPTDCGTPAFFAKSGLLATAAMKHDVALSQSSTKSDLDLVDELEGHFEKK
jgi:hypothetical protein